MAETRRARSSAARNRLSLVYEPGMAVSRYLDPGIVDLGGDTIPGGGGEFPLPPDVPSMVSAPSAAPGAAAAGGGGGGGGVNLLASIAGALLDPRTWKLGERLLDGLFPSAPGMDPLGNPLGGPDAGPVSGSPGPANGLDPLGNPAEAPAAPTEVPGAPPLTGGELAGFLPTVPFGGPTMGFVPAQANPFGTDVIWSPEPLDLSAFADAPALAGAPAGALGSSLAAYGGDAALQGGLLGGSLYGAEAMPGVASTLGELSGLSAIAFPAQVALTAAMLGYGIGTFGVDDPVHGGRVDIGVDPATGRAVILGAGGKRWDEGGTRAYVQRQLDFLNDWMGGRGLALRPDFRWGWEFGDNTANRNTIWDRLGFLAGDAFTTTNPALQTALAPDRFYQGWADFAAALGGGPAGVPMNPTTGYQLTPQDVTDVFHEGLLPLFGGQPADYSDRWLDLAQRQANLASQILGTSDGMDASAWMGLPSGFLDAFANGRDPRTLPSAVTGDQYAQMFLGQGSGPADIWSLAGPAPQFQSPDPFGIQAAIAQNQATTNALLAQAMATPADPTLAAGN